MPESVQPEFRFDDRSVSVTELEALLDAMDDSPRIPFPARAVFHRGLRDSARESRSLEHTISSTLRVADELVGFVRIITDHAYFYYLCDVMIHPGWQGHGLGRQLVEQAVHECRRRGYMKIFLTSLPGLEDFYAQFGFRATMSPVLTLRGEDESNYPPLP